MIDELDEEDWIDLEPTVRPGVVLPDAAVRVTERNGRFKASVVLRREAATWAFDSGPRYRVQIGGAALNVLRITPDMHKGRFEASNLKGTARILLGVIPLWPAEARDLTSADHSLVDGSLVLRLPAEFAKAGRTVRAIEPPASAVQVPKLKGDPAPHIRVTTAAPGLSAPSPSPSPSTTPRLRALTIADPSLPPPGRSALDERLRGATSSLEDMLDPDIRKRRDEFRAKKPI